jgi:hypothetical protein
MFQRAGGIQLVAPLLRSCNSPSNSQILYEIAMCLWQMSFTRPAAELMATAGVVKGLVEVCRNAQKEKVFRVALSTLKNLITYSGLAVASDMAEAGLLKVIATKQLQVRRRARSAGARGRRGSCAGCSCAGCSCAAAPSWQAHARRRVAAPAPAASLPLAAPEPPARPLACLCSPGVTRTSQTCWASWMSG